MSILNIAYQRSNLGVGEGQEAPTQIWEKREGEERGHMAQHEQPHQLELDLVYGWIWNLIRIIIFKNIGIIHEKALLIICENCYYEERELVDDYFMPQPISRVKDSHPSWCLERPLRYLRRLNGFISYRCKLQHLVDISSSAYSSFHLKFFHHISTLWSEAHLVSYSSL